MKRTHVVTSVFIAALTIALPTFDGSAVAIGSTNGVTPATPSGASSGAMGQVSAEPGARATEVGTSRGAARKFARAVTRRARDGWQIRDMTVDFEDDGDMTVSLTMASSKAARRFALAWTDHGSRVTGYSNITVRVPRERRIYPVQAEVFAVLAREAPTSVEYECSSFFLGGLENGVAIDPMDYYIVEDRKSGWAASSALASVLARSLESGLDLVSVEEGESDTARSETSGRAIAFSFANQTGDRETRKDSRIVHVELDDRDRVTAVEVRRVPYVYPWQVYRRSAELLTALESRAAIARVAITGGDDRGDDRGTVILDGTLVIDMADFAVGEIGCSC